jgi:hypothetical protein
MKIAIAVCPITYRVRMDVTNSRYKRLLESGLVRLLATYSFHVPLDGCQLWHPPFVLQRHVEMCIFMLQCET